MAKDSPFNRGKYRSVKRNGKWVTIDKNGKVVKTGQRVVEGLKRGKERIKNTVKSMKISNLKKRLKTEGSKYIYADKPGPGGKQETVYQQKKRTGGSGKSRTWQNPEGAKGGGKPSSGDPKTWPKGKKKDVKDTTYGTGMPSNYKGGHRGGGKETDNFNKNKEVKTNKEAWKTDAAKKWLEKTRNSPAAKAGFGEKERWLLQKQHRDWKATRGR